ncbi:hypothetical protein BU24DRAFT_424008 [Aaosphaeria arxii CBS 175.79]|uniref:histidine kinase n=1 Tax=Aaosphaeria arxii CBS 175.79 TaxID=1450172 RepID=A0A6A5XPN0_9PLEO|nr:uncharacterized protein BU24DRAFT_424008 [Aaosphaeria arxii CBS 175.79]KAF2015102.1 hypothetical protein BU24DRAFT_424008 [Aaosphaeria arxii CBS 175.79]
MQHSSRPVRSVSEAKRLRDVFLLYSLAFKDLPSVQLTGTSPDSWGLPKDHVASPSKDSALTAFAQLACTRLGAKRAMISLVDKQHQHILAEATPELSLRASSRSDVHNSLWLGSVSIPRSLALCESVLNLDASSVTGKDPVVIINDMSQSEIYSNYDYVKNAPHLRFYAGIPLVSPSGAIVGALCIHDDKSRDGLSEADVIVLLDLAITIAEYLDTYTIKNHFRHGEQLTRGLISFSDGASTLQPFQDDVEQALPPSAELPNNYEAENTIDQSQHNLEPSAKRLPELGPQDHESITSNSSDLTVTTRMLFGAKPAAQTSRSGHSGHSTVRRLQESILPANAKSMFARAATIMQASSDLDGVAFLDASVAGVRDRDHGRATDPHLGSLSSSGESNDSKSSESSSLGSQRSFVYRPNQSSKSDSPKKCQVLACAISAKAAKLAGGDLQPILEVDFTSLLRQFPNGKVLNFDNEGELLSSSAEDSDTSSSASTDAAAAEEASKRKNTAMRLKRSSKVLRTALPHARSVLFVPLWDYERSRWFAGCLCWSNSLDRLLSPLVDMSYVKVFGSSIMTELSRLDALATTREKTTFMASVSHELRSPLHGILGTLEFLNETALDSFQSTMLNSLTACGRTLLDTINHLLDHAKMNDVRPLASSKKLKGTQTIRIYSKPNRFLRPNSWPANAPGLDLGIVTEEVVEAMFSGQSYLSVVGGHGDLPDVSPGQSTTSSPDHVLRRKTCYIVLDLSQEDDWSYCLPIGAWRRIVMNIFGNAMKYTHSGRIHVQLSAGEPQKDNDRSRVITLTITDSGSGIGADFLANQIFEPFTQENPHSSGTGLGLSIVRQIIESIGGKIEVQSDQSVGTKMTIKMGLLRPENIYEVSPQRQQFLSILPRLKNKRICILHRKYEPPTETSGAPQDVEGMSHFVDALAKTLTETLGMKVVQTTEWEGHDADLVICPEPSFAYLNAIRQHRRSDGKAPVSIFIALDALEASTLRSDVRVSNKESVVEIMTQPCGPYKLAYIIDRCLNRFGLPEENVPSPFTPLQSPHVSLSRRARDESLGSVESSGGSDYFGRSSEMYSSNSSLKFPVAQDDEAEVNTPTVKTTPKATPVEDQGLTPPSLNEIQKGARILITDDNPINRKLLVAFLRKRSTPYAEATNGLEALLSYQERRGRFDVVLMDLSMPVMDGMTATRRIREYEQKHKAPRSYIIALTGLASASARLEAWSSGVDFFMTKPVDFKELGRVIEKERERRSNVVGD